MKSFRLLGLAAALWSVSVLPAAAWVYSKGKVENRGGAACHAGARNFNRPPLANRPWNGRDARWGNNRWDNNRWGNDGWGNNRWGNDGAWNNDGRRDRRRDRDRNNNDSGDGGWGGFGYWGGPFYPYGPYAADYRVDYSVNTPSRQSNSPFQIALNDGVHLSSLDSGYPGARPAVGGWVNPYPPQPTTIPAPGSPTGVAPAPTGPDLDLVVGVQRELRRLGYYRGIVNGVSDARTRSAIRAYEAGVGLPVTGVIGGVLVRSLNVF